MLALDDLPKLQRQVETLKEKRYGAKGAYDQIMKKLKEKFKCTSVKEAQKLLRNMLEELQELNEDYAKSIKQFKKKWKHILRKIK